MKTSKEKREGRSFCFALFSPPAKRLGGGTGGRTQHCIEGKASKYNKKGKNLRSAKLRWKSARFTHENRAHRLSPISLMQIINRLNSLAKHLLLGYRPYPPRSSPSIASLTFGST